MSERDAVLTDVRGFMKSRVILTAAELDFFTILDEKPASANEIALKKGLDLRAATRVLDCLTAIGFLEKWDSIYHLTKKASFYSSHHPETVLPMVLHMNHVWDRWSGLTEIVKTGIPAEREPGIAMDDESWKSFIGAMHVAGLEVSQKIADEYDLSRFTHLLDIGGASGTYTIAFLRHNPAMTAVIFDLENVIPMARERIATEGLSKRVELAAGDFYKDELPTGCDLALLSAIIHQNSPHENLDLYIKIFKALKPGGTLLIRDHIMDSSRTKPPAGAMFAINMLVNTGGDTYTFEEVKEGLEKAGFTNIKQLRYGVSMDCLVEGRKPE
ncbi:MAG: class I SAM-dependent methyltransferase [Candidatus Schekmanbacteria bacterium]|nr:class I SAM-dependent methyltransferase [Candidatus Schekmanbacteria bacterium]